MPIPLDTILITDRCRLRCVNDNDRDSFWSATRYPGFCDGMPWEAPLTPDELKNWAQES